MHYCHFHTDRIVLILLLRALFISDYICLSFVLSRHLVALEAVDVVVEDLGILHLGRNSKFC